ncbi:MAG TPA: hypothetical protein V6C81_09840 [Planktothrix sp.]|jgi:hypothetical protein
MLLSEVNPEFQLALRQELLAGEELLWWAYPDPEAVARSLLPFSVIWLSGLFLMSVGMMINAPGDTTHLLTGLIVILVLVASAGVLELIFVPRRAARTIFVLTNKRAVSMCITKKLTADEDVEKRILRVEPSKPERFYLVNLPSQILMMLVTVDVLRMCARHFDFFLAAGFGLILTGWMRPWFRDMRYPMAKYRDAPKILYSAEDMFISTETLQRELIRNVRIRKVAKDLFNVFLISDVAGCLRFRLLAGKDKAQKLLEYFGVNATADQMSNL